MLYHRSQVRTVIEANGEYGYTVAAIWNNGDESEYVTGALSLPGDVVLYRSAAHLDLKSARGYLIDLRNALNSAACLWCADPARLITEVDGLDVFAFHSEECHTEALREAHDEEMVR